MESNSIESGKISVALISDEPGWHSKQLIDSFGRQSCEVKTVSLQQCYIASDDNAVHLPGFGYQSPHGVFVRGIPAGSLDTVTFYLDVLHALARLGVFVYNDATMIERSVDKGMTSFLLSLAGISTPSAWSFSDWGKATVIVEEQLRRGCKMVLKPVFGSQGKDLKLIRNMHDWQVAYDRNAGNERVCYLQTFVENGEDGDMRVFVIAGKVVAAMKRIGEGWINNVASGAECFAMECSDEVVGLSQKAVECLDIFYGGVDLIRDCNGKLWVIEINSIPAWKGLQSVSDMGISDCLVRGFLEQYRCYNKSRFRAP